MKLCTTTEYEQGDVFLARLDSSCDSSRLVRPATSPGFYDDFDPTITYRGDWSHDESFDEPAWLSISYTDMPGAEATLGFQGEALNWIFTRAPNRGVAEVLIDGVSKGTVDLYSPVVQWQSKLRFCCFAGGKHVVTIRATGEAHADSKGRFVDVDGFLVEASAR
jgi:hypothetical protein